MGEGWSSPPDVSFNNILIHEFEEGSKTVRRGILSDWDLSKYKEHMSDAGPRQPDRTVRRPSQSLP